MNSYYVPEIDLRIIRNNPEIVDKLRKNLSMNQKRNHYYSNRWIL